MDHFLQERGRTQDAKRSKLLELAAVLAVAINLSSQCYKYTSFKIIDKGPFLVCVMPREHAYSWLICKCVQLSSVGSPTEKSNTFFDVNTMYWILMLISSKE